MIKLIGAAMTIGASSLIGFSVAQRYAERCRLLKLWLSILDTLQTEIYFQSQMLPQIFRRIATLNNKDRITESFNEAACRLELGEGFSVAEVWDNLLQDSWLSALSKNDLLLLNELGFYLGATDRADQCEKIKACKARLETNLRYAEDESDKRLGLFRYLGFAVGAGLTLWFM